MTKDPASRIATRKELERLIADRKNDPPVPDLDHPKPNWMVDADDPRRRHIRMRERRINHLRERLEGNARKLSQDFERSR